MIEGRSEYEQWLGKRTAMTTLRWPFWAKLWLTLVLAMIAGSAAVDVLVSRCWWPSPVEGCGPPLTFEPEDLPPPPPGFQIVPPSVPGDDI